MVHMGKKVQSGREVYKWVQSRICYLSMAPRLDISYERKTVHPNSKNMDLKGPNMEL